MRSNNFSNDIQIKEYKFKSIYKSKNMSESNVTYIKLIILHIKP